MFVDWYWLLATVSVGLSARIPTHGLSTWSLHVSSFGFPHNMVAGIPEEISQDNKAEVLSTLITQLQKSQSIHFTDSFVHEVTKTQSSSLRRFAGTEELV